MGAPKSLAPLASKSKAVLPPLNMGGLETKKVQDSKLSHKIQNDESKSHNDTEFESSKTLMPRENTMLDEIGALMGHDRSMAEL